MNMKPDTDQGFTYHIEHRDRCGRLKGRWALQNLVPDAGRDYVVAHGLSGTAWYIGLYTANRAPLANDTMTSFMADCAETSNYTTTANARLTLTGVETSGVFSNVASPAVFTFTVDTTIFGSFLSSGATRGTTSGTLLSAALRGTSKLVEAGDSLTVVSGIPVTPV